MNNTNNTSFAKLLIDHEGIIKDFSSEDNNLLNYTKKDLINKNILLLFPKEYHKRLELLASKPDSKEKNIVYYPLINSNNECLKAKTEFTINTSGDKKFIEAKIKFLSYYRPAFKLYQKLFTQHTAMMTLSTTEDGFFIDVNQQFLQTLGYKKHEVIGVSSKELDFFEDYEVRQNLLKKINQNGFVSDEEVNIITNSNELINCLISVNRIELNNEDFILSTFTNISKLKKAEGEVSYLFKQQKLLADISQLLNSTNNLELVLGYVLRIIGEHTEVSRVYIFENSKDNNFTSNTFEWCNKGIEAQKANLQNIDYKEFRTWKELLMFENRIMADNISSLPKEIFEVLNAQGIKSVLVYPIFVNKEFYGFIGFDECKLFKNWESSLIQLLRTISIIISNAFERRENTSEK